ncbi:hypothetical protein GPL21_33500 [Bradyrhizobium pachyrhizi]|uniref:Uncharacterized protein n=1 Tax=Bradyrhizobium pachyrhizi TaxID=280333 RepID=A0A844T4N0_9BRAD|nr:hypothetical protein [Bradyrhizobium pachyrhizi]MVT70001.1 hypothetical protein [Bradyrhizobium pachyrhizi]
MTLRFNVFTMMGKPKGICNMPFPAIGRRKEGSWRGNYAAPTAHLISAYRRLNSEKSPVSLACTFGRSTKEQQANPVGLKLEELSV